MSKQIGSTFSHSILEQFFLNCCENLVEAEKEDSELTKNSKAVSTLYEQIQALLPESEQYLLGELEEQLNAVTSTEFDYVILQTIRLTIELLRVFHVIA